MPLNAEDILVNIAPNLTNSDFWLELADEEISADTCPEKREHLKAYLAAHLQLLNARGASGAIGAVTEEREGDLSRSYAVQQGMSQSGLASTVYGQRYIDILKKCRGGNFTFTEVEIRC
jgi:hypothetical protein